METAQTIIKQTLEKFALNNQVELEDRYDKRLQNMDVKVNQWLSSIEQGDKVLFLKLLENFTYCNKEKVMSFCQHLYNKYKEKEPDKIDATLYVPVTAEGGIYCGADVIMHDFKYANGILKGRLIPRPFQFDQYDWNKDMINNIVLIDDIIGTGITFRNSLFDLMERCPSIFKENRKIYLIALYICNRGKEKIKDISKEIGRGN